MTNTYVGKFDDYLEQSDGHLKTAALPKYEDAPHIKSLQGKLNSLEKLQSQSSHNVLNPTMQTNTKATARRSDSRERALSFKNNAQMTKRGDLTPGQHEMTPTK